MAWALWLAAPLLVGIGAAIWTWWRSRPAAVPTGEASMRAHREYLDALVQPARSTARVAHPEGPAPVDE